MNSLEPVFAGMNLLVRDMAAPVRSEGRRRRPLREGAGGGLISPSHSPSHRLSRAEGGTLVRNGT
jgi:hypothetical protein